MMQLHGRGIHRILLAARMAAVAKLIYEAPEEMGYSIASLFNKSAYKTLAAPDTYFPDR
jgi:hypothetical protein